MFVFVNVEKQAFAKDFLEMKLGLKHPTVTASFLIDYIASMTCDGATVTISSKNGVAGRLRSLVNPKLFVTHCPPY